MKKVFWEDLSKEMERSCFVTSVNKQPGHLETKMMCVTFSASMNSIY